MKKKEGNYEVADFDAQLKIMQIYDGVQSNNNAEHLKI